MSDDWPNVDFGYWSHPLMLLILVQWAVQLVCLLFLAGQGIDNPAIFWGVWFLWIPVSVVLLICATRLVLRRAPVPRLIYSAFPAVAAVGVAFVVWNTISTLPRSDTGLAVTLFVALLPVVSGWVMGARQRLRNGQN